MKLLFIDDDRDSIEPTMMALRDEFDDILIRIESDFNRAMSSISVFQPDIIILDLLRHTPSGDFIADGLKPLDSLWNTRFATTIVYSAEAWRVADTYPEVALHPLTEIINKGLDSEDSIVDAVKRFTPFVDVLTATRAAVEAQLSIVLKRVVPQVMATLGYSEQEQIDAISRACYRRLSAVADDSFNGEGTAWAWERYLYPPVSRDLLLGDIIVKMDATTESVDDFRLVLSPSCDLVATNNRKPKVNSVLVAKCCSISDGLSSIAISRKPKDVRRRILSQGFYERMLPIPALVEVIPDMMANLTDLELIQFDKIGDKPGCQFRRIASVSSPFRELVGWAYIQTAGRPGLPETNLDSWSDDVVADARRK